MGSGHILVYAFDVLMKMYENDGYSQRDAAQSILENNLYGLDIDERAAQLAYFAVMMKARQYDRRIFTRGIQPHVYAIAESNDIDTYTRDYFVNNDPKLKAALDSVMNDLRDAKEYGSILTVAPVDFAALYARMDEVQNDISLYRESALNTILPLIRVAEVLAQQYDVVVTNPPYMGSSNMDARLSDFVKKHYPDSKSDLFAVFIERCGQMTGKNRYQAMITQHAWMFLSSFEKLRAKLLLKDTINMAHLGPRAFEEIGGEVVQTTSFVLRNSHITDYKGTYCRLIEPTTQQGKEDMFLAGENRYTAQQSNFSKIPGLPVAYWVSEAYRDLYCKGEPLRKYATVFEGLKTRDNERFLRLWHEVYSQKWIHYAKGGSFRRWYGNGEYVVNWGKNGDEVRGFKKSSGANFPYYFQPTVTYSALTSYKFSGRFVFDQIFGGGGGGITNSTIIMYILAFVNTVVFHYLMNVLSQTLNFEVGQIGQQPIIVEEKSRSRIETITSENVKLSKLDWDSYETSWDFKGHPLVLGRLPEPVWGDVPDRVAFQNTSISYTYQMYWKKTCEYRFEKLKANEEELNRIFIDIYGLQDELTPDVADKDVTVHRIFDTKDDVPESMQGSSYVRTKRDEIVSLLSYAVGCMFGRYSLDRQGLIFAGGNFDSVYWKFKGQAALNEQGDPIDGGYAGISLANYHYPKFHDAENWEDATSLSYEPDVDGVIPITDEEYLEDDIVSRLCNWLKAAYGADTLEENLDFIAGALGGKGNSSREIIRSYFLRDFFKDHCKTYQKRPIYWLFDSGKQNGFKALIYLHRYTPDTIGNLRVDYLHKMQRVYESEINRMQDMIDHSTNAREVAASTKRKEKLQKQLKECRDYDEMIAHLALSRIKLDLDDGVKVNYEKIQTASDGKKYAVLAKI